VRQCISAEWRQAPLSELVATIEILWEVKGNSERGVLRALLNEFTEVMASQTVRETSAVNTSPFHPVLSKWAIHVFILRCNEL
jgi:hypothetical protein